MQELLSTVKSFIILYITQIASLEAELVAFHEKEAHFEKRAAALTEQEEHLSSMQQEIAMLKESIHQVPADT